ncbi:MULTISPECIES: hypothetical protein [unclassified Diaphorobacter]|uniref:hypothetical protein n=1 Tax=unclassified Diaphorobacter TaxID=2649760 RepID=UPI001C12FF24|nr:MULTISPECIES: hypothetical protein [unclassified Diaphorobacter]
MFSILEGSVTGAASIGSTRRACCILHGMREKQPPGLDHPEHHSGKPRIIAGSVNPGNAWGVSAYFAVRCMYRRACPPYRLAQIVDNSLTS